MTRRARSAKSSRARPARLAYTLRRLLTRPGELAREIDEGRDRRAMRPLTLLLNLIPLFFLLGGGAQRLQRAQSFLARRPDWARHRDHRRGSPRHGGSNPRSSRSASSSAFAPSIRCSSSCRRLSYGGAIGVLERAPAQAVARARRDRHPLHVLQLPHIDRAVRRSALPAQRRERAPGRRPRGPGDQRHVHDAVASSRVRDPAAPRDRAKPSRCMAWGFVVSLVLTTISVDRGAADGMTVADARRRLGARRLPFLRRRADRARTARRAASRASPCGARSGDAARPDRPSRAHARVLIARPGELAREIDEARDRALDAPGFAADQPHRLFFLLGGGVGRLHASGLIRSRPVGNDGADDRAARRQAGASIAAVYHERLEQRFRARRTPC